ncbi:MAG: hypothetical protein ABIX01_13025 [Chitinophagaceae bacterium]
MGAAFATSAFFGRLTNAPWQTSVLVPVGNFALLSPAIARCWLVEFLKSAICRQWSLALLWNSPNKKYPALAAIVAFYCTIFFLPLGLDKK